MDSRLIVGRGLAIILSMLLAGWPRVSVTVTPVSASAGEGLAKAVGLRSRPINQPVTEIRQPFYPLGAIGDACQSPTGCDARQGLACHNFTCVHCSRVCESCRYDHDCCLGLGCSHDGFCHGSDQQVCQRTMGRTKA